MNKLSTLFIITIFAHSSIAVSQIGKTQPAEAEDLFMNEKCDKLTSESSLAAGTMFGQNHNTPTIEFEDGTAYVKDSKGHVLILSIVGFKKRARLTKTKLDTKRLTARTYPDTEKIYLETDSKNKIDIEVRFKIYDEYQDKKSIDLNEFEFLLDSKGNFLGRTGCLKTEPKIFRDVLTNEPSKTQKKQQEINRGAASVDK